MTARDVAWWTLGAACGCVVFALVQGRSGPRWDRVDTRALYAPETRTGPVVVRLHDRPAAGLAFPWAFDLWEGDTIDVYATPDKFNRLRFDVQLIAPEHRP